MQNVIALWGTLDARKRVIVAAATLAMFAAILMLARAASQPTLALLYSGLEPGPAGEVIGALEARGVVMDVRGGAIYVPASERDALRMTLAAEGLPGNSAKGYEILDNLSGFGTTSQMFDAAYWRAKEGELARTIVSSPMITSARVHIAIPPAQGFRNRGAPAGSVTVTTNGDTLGNAHAKALRSLVASAVPGLAPEDVSVIDSRGGLVSSSDDPAASGSGPLSETLKRNVERLLEARVGPGNAIVELSVDTALESETILERVIDPEGRVAISTETTETAAAESDSATGAVTVASNLPAGDGAAPPGASSSNNTETRERVNYEVSETTREVSRGPGTVRRITVAVLVDGLRTTDAAGEAVWSPRPEEELAALQDLVASAVGYDEARGDSITIKSMEFSPVAPEGTQASAGMFSATGLDLMAALRLAVLAAVAVVLGLFVVRPIMRERLPAAEPAAALAAPNTGAAPIDPTIALTGEIDNAANDPVPDRVLTSDFTGEPDASGGLPAIAAGGDPVERLRALIAERQSETVEILRGWMETDEGPAR